jgi:polysaccharide biosynthesis transport protein
MNSHSSDPQDGPAGGSPAWREVLFVLMKHKWKIVICTVLGLAAAIAVFFFETPMYESQAKLLVRYVVDRSAVDPVESAASRQDRTGDNLINSEVEILTSWDLAVQVTEKIGKERLLAGSGIAPSTTAAAKTVSQGLKVTALKGSNVIYASYKNRDPGLATLVLSELIRLYFDKHLKVHRSAEAFAFVTEQSEAVRGRLTSTETALKPLRASVGIISLSQATTSLTTEVTKTEDQLQAAEAELAEQTARVAALEHLLLGDHATSESTSPDNDSSPTNPEGKKPANPATTNPTGEPNTRSIAASTPAASVPATSPPKEEANNAVIQKYQALVSQLNRLHDAYLELLSKYTPENRSVKVKQEQIDALEGKRRDLEEKYPDLIAKVPTTLAGSGPIHLSDLPTERARLAGFQARTDALKVQLQRLKERVKQFTDVAPQIAQLERTKEIDEENYKYFGASLEKARIDEALNPSKMPNISTVQEPTPAGRVTIARNKLMGGLAGGGLGLGVGIALLLELLLNRTIKRPLELESRLQIPLMLTIPYVSQNGHRRLRLGKNGKNGNNGGSAPHKPSRLATTPWDASHFIRPFSEVVRDRLSLYFEVNGLNHKPKLVGVAGFSAGAGASTLAGGLAAALSETGDGKVLLVDMNVGEGDLHPFFEGKPAYSLTAAIEPSAPIDSAADNLYLAAVTPTDDGRIPLGLRKFHALMPDIKESDYDYIIFDMPPLSQTSPTIAMSGYMDKMMLVVEAGENDRDVVRRRYSELVAARANISVIFNKARTYGPQWLEDES